MVNAPISLRAALKNVASERYNKTNIFYFFILQLIYAIIIGYCNYNKIDIGPKSIMVVSALFLYIVITGIVTNAILRGSRGKSSIFPNPFEDSLSHLKIGFFYNVGLLANVVIFYTIFLIIGAIFVCIFAIIAAASGSIFSAESMPSSVLACVLVALVFIIVLLLSVVLFSAIFFQFLREPKLSSMFAYAKSIPFVFKEKRRIGILCFKIFILLLISLGVFLGVLTPINVVSTLSGVNMNVQIIISQTFSSVLGIILSMYIIDLDIQFIKPYILRKKGSQIEEQNNGQVGIEENTNQYSIDDYIE